MRSRSLSPLVAKSLLASILIAAVPPAARANFDEFSALPTDADLKGRITRAAEASLKSFPKLTADNLAISVVDLTRPDHLVRADYRGNESFYPASIVKLFFMVAAFHQNHLTPEIERALREMIRVSDNDAASFLVDVLTDTTSGSELEGKALEEFLDRRRSLN